MRKAELPIICPDCSKTFTSEGARDMHRRAKHKIKVHAFSDLADSLKSRQAPTQPRTAAKAKSRVSGNLILVLAVLGLLLASGAVVFFGQ